MDRKGISPVIATVIIVAVTIAVSIAVAYWMGGLASFFTRFEKIEIGAAYAAWGGEGGDDLVITLSEVKNTGSADATITSILINGKLIEDYGLGITSSPSTPKLILAGGKLDNTYNGKLTITVPDVKTTPEKPPFTSGTTLSVTLHTASGRDYPVNVAVP